MPRKLQTKMSDTHTQTHQLQLVHHVSTFCSLFLIYSLSPPLFSFYTHDDLINAAVINPFYMLVLCVIELRKSMREKVRDRLTEKSHSVFSVSAPFILFPLICEGLIKTFTDVPIGTKTNQIRT